MTAAPRFLLMSRIGPDSLHRSWLGEDDDRGFDVLLSAYAPAVAPVAAPGVTFEYRPGSKVAGYAAMLGDHRRRLEDYDYVAIFDDDLLAGPGDIARLFDIVARENLKIAQPALTHDSHFTYAALLRHPSFRLRYVTFVEMMCPVFRADVLLQVLPLFSLGYESGIDLIWCNLVHDSPKDFAVIDATPVRHTRRIGKAKAMNGFVGARRYEDDIHAILQRFGLPWLPCVPYGGVGADGAVVDGRLPYARDAARLALVAARHAPFGDRMRNIAVYWKHLMTKPAVNLPTAWPAAGASTALSPAPSD